MQLKLETTNRALALLFTIATIAFFFFMSWEKRWVGDDGLINSRVIENILHGEGPVFNVGERVEVYTSPLWIFTLVLLGFLGLKPDTASVYVGLGLSVIGMSLAAWGGFTIKQQASPAQRKRLLFLPLGILVYVALPPGWDYATSGLETGLSLAWLGLSYFFSCRLIYGLSNRFLVYALVLGLGPLIRPELSIFSIGMSVPLLSLAPWRDRQASTKWFVFGAKYIATLAVLPLAYQIFRMGYFAALTSNTALSKEAFVSNWIQGWYYFKNFFGLYRLSLPLFLLFVIWCGFLKKAAFPAVRAVLIAPLLSGMFYCFYVVRVGGGFMHGRLFLPGLFGMLLPMASLTPDIFGASKWARFVKVMMVALLLAWVIFCASSLRMPIENQHHIGDERGWYTRRSTNGNPTSVDHYAPFSFYRDAENLRSEAAGACPDRDKSMLGTPHPSCAPFVLVDKPHYGRLRTRSRTFPLDRATVSPNTVMVALRGALGILGMVIGPNIHIVDRYGIADPIASRLIVTRRGRPGHEKSFSNAWLVARFAKAQKEEDMQVRAAKTALACPLLTELIAAVNAPLTMDRFLSNLRNAYSFQTLRIPTLPTDAAYTLCP